MGFQTVRSFDPCLTFHEGLLSAERAGIPEGSWAPKVALRACLSPRPGIARPARLDQVWIELTQTVQDTMFATLYQMSTAQSKMVFASYLAARLRPPTPHVSHSGPWWGPAACAHARRTEPGSQEMTSRGVSREPGAGVGFGR
jgi:hypothetical protein